MTNGFKITVTKRGGYTIIQKFSPRGGLMTTKVKRFTQETIGDKRVLTKDEFIFNGEQYFVTDAVRSTTNKVYDENNELLGALRITRQHEDRRINKLQDIIDNFIAHRNGRKQFITPEGNIVKEVRF